MSLDFEDGSSQEIVVTNDADTSKRVNAADKRMINAMTDVNQLVPFKYKWAWDMYLAGCANHWMPQEYDMKVDAVQWNSTILSNEDRIIIARNLSAMSGNNTTGIESVVLGIYRHITAPEARQYLLRQGFEEALQSHVCSHVLSAIDLDISNLVRVNVTERNAFLAPFIETLVNLDFSTGTFETNQQFLKAMVVYSCLMKSLFSLVDITQLIDLGRHNKVPAMVSMYQLLLRDQIMHCNFGIEVIEAIKTENPQLWTPELKAEIVSLFTRAVEIEVAYAKIIDPAKAHQFKIFLEVVANRRIAQIGLNPIFESAKNPFPWMGELIGLRKDDTSFDTRVVENKTTGTLDWD